MFFKCFSAVRSGLKAVNDEHLVAFCSSRYREDLDWRRDSLPVCSSEQKTRQ